MHTDAITDDVRSKVVDLLSRQEKINKTFVDHFARTKPVSWFRMPFSEIKSLYQLRYEIYLEGGGRGLHYKNFIDNLENPALCRQDIDCFMGKNPIFALWTSPEYDVVYGMLGSDSFQLYDDSNK